MVFKADFSVVNTPLKQFQQGHWNSNIVDFLSEYEAICKTDLGHESQGPRWGWLMKKPRVENLVQLSL
jgi:hypothetical protein